MDWQTPAGGCDGAVALGPTRPTARDLSVALKRAGIADVDSVALPGSLVVLPSGVELIARLADVTRAAYAELGYALHDFPMLAPVDAYGPLERLSGLEGKLLRVGSDADWAAGRPRAVLSPSGEAVVYAHWARTVRRPEHLPNRVLRRTTYFRPMPHGARSGRGPFRSIEAGDVFETHACLHPDEAEAEVDAVVSAMRAVADWYRIPVLVTTRPLWGNNAAISGRTVGLDALNPAGGTIQVGSAYDQGDRLSRAFSIRVGGGGDGYLPAIVTSAVSRRLVLAHVFTFLRRSGDVLLHPDVAPHEANIAVGDDDVAVALRAELTAAGVRARVTTTDRPGSAAAAAAREGIPVRARLTSPRWAGDAWLLRVERGDTRATASLACPTTAIVATTLRSAVDLVRAAMDNELAAIVSNEVRDASGSPAGKVEQWTRDGHVVLVPLGNDETCTAALEERIRGEVLGFWQAPDLAPCWATGTPTRWRAAAGPRG